MSVTVQTASPVDRPVDRLFKKIAVAGGRPKQTESKVLQSGRSRSTVTVDRETCTLIRAFARTSVDLGGRPARPDTGTTDRAIDRLRSKVQIQTEF